MSMRGNKARVGVYLDKGTLKQLEELSSALHIDKSAVIAQAIARWHRVEPLVRDLRKQVTNGNGDSSV
jgi:predicted transcriptional regulator